MPTKDWNALVDGTPASAITAWVPLGSPSAGDIVIFSSTSVVTCSMDLTVAISSLIVQSSYTGYIQCVSNLTVSSGIVLGGF